MKFVQREIKGKKVTIYFTERGLREQVNLILQSKNEKLIDEYFLLVHEQQLRERADQRKSMSLEVSMDVGYQFEDADSNVEELYIQQERMESLHAAIGTLTEDQRWLVEQVYVLGRNHTEIAKELNVSRQAIENRINKILNKIKKFLI